MRIVIRGGRLVDPANTTDGIHDLFIADGRVAAIGLEPEGFQADRVFDADGLVICPGLIDLCARLREPGQEYKATIASETRAAASAGITTLVCPPDTDPVIDETAVVQLIRRRAQAAGYARVFTLGAMTRGLAGEQLAEMAALKEAGCVGVSNGSRFITNTLVLRRALEYAASHDLIVFITPQDPWLSVGGLAHDGETATRLGLNGIPTAAETAALARDLALIEDIGVRVHFCRLSAARSVELVAGAQARGLPVSADVGVHQLHLTEQDLDRFDSRCHVLPPLRSEQDRTGLRMGVQQGVVGAICSDHQPHEPDAKQRPFGETEPGISSLETLLALGLRLVTEDALSLNTAIERLTLGPARILGLDSGHLGPGATADVCVFEPNAEWTLSPGDLQSSGLNTPFAGWRFHHRVRYTFLAGRLVYESCA